ncbi:hypothetical protein [Mucilaginibacter flavidus]|uniref:hypothetical protein n=1 Tax=Mucilaginibacter flavidus TaxID=2949309 RepID=UPI0020932003|nr:hypothetical protein [Mucilaginibacter flavidus]MCO5946985.1 hypothetical protein [Mucilaginibacter flavidus]
MFNRQAKSTSQLQLQFMAKCLFFFIGLSLITFCCYAQRPLTDSRQSSVYTYIYKITDEDLLDFYMHPDKKPDDKILHNPIDSFKTSRYWENNLPRGNYLKVFAEKNKLVYDLVENHTAFIKFLDNGYDQRFALFDRNGNVVSTAVVRVNNKPCYLIPGA